MHTSPFFPPITKNLHSCCSKTNSMGFFSSFLSIPKSDSVIIIPFSLVNRTARHPILTLASSFPILSTSNPIHPLKGHPPPQYLPVVIRKCQFSANPRSSQEDEDDSDDESSVQDLRVPDHWLLPSKALEESKWLKVTLHKWLDDEYCPEETNVEISKVAAQSYYESLVEEETDLGEILLKMARELESISYKESFHGAFSSANAAVNLISQRIELEGNT